MYFYEICYKYTTPFLYFLTYPSKCHWRNLRQDPEICVAMDPPKKVAFVNYVSQRSTVSLLLKM